MDRRPRTRIRWPQIRLAAICALVYGLAAGLLMPGVWPMMPFPAVAPVEIAALLGLLFGFLVRRWWVLALPLTTLIALDPPHTGFAGSLIALMIVWPFSAAGSALGIGLGRVLQRQLLRRTLRAARKRDRAAKPATAVRQPVSVAGR
ncbi:MAG TPA: hypothetical protein VGI67_10760 [Thermoleophilaceae bacterium]|jgi:hypothetical protein